MGSRLQDVVMRDTRASQPLATAVSAGTLYFVTDELVTERSNGTTWDDYSDGGSASITALTGDVTATGPGSVAATIAADAVTNAKLANMADQTIKGNDSGGAQNPQDLSANEVSVVLDGATDPFLRTSAAPSAAITQLTGDVTAGPGSGSQAATIANAAVTYAKIQNVTNARLLGNFTGGAAAPAEYSLGAGIEHSAGAIRTKADIRTEQVGITVDGGGSLLTIGDKGFKSFPVAGTITAWRLMADAAGDIDFDVTLDDYATGFPPTTSILTPDLSGVQKNEATGLSIAVVAGDVFGFEITGTPVTITRVTLEITIVVTG